MIVVLLGFIAMTGLTGWLMTTEMFWGEERLDDIDKFLADTLVIVAVLHVCSLIVASVSHDENLVRAIIISKKRPGDQDGTKR